MHRKESDVQCSDMPMAQAWWGGEWRSCWKKSEGRFEENKHERE